MSNQESRASAARRFFAGVTEHAFHARLGVVDPQLVDYISDLLNRFMRNDDIFSLRGPTGGRLDQVADMLAEAEARRGKARRTVHRHIGDFTLFWTGVYPEVVERMRRTSQKDSLIDYSAQGKRAYYVASTIRVQKEFAPTSLLQRLSHEFEMCVYGLGEVRRQWDNRDDGDFSALFLN